MNQVAVGHPANHSSLENRWPTQYAISATATTWFTVLLLVKLLVERPVAVFGVRLGRVRLDL